ncbi:unnamed protein product, partial [Symbiodinium sp. KB8]
MSAPQFTAAKAQKATAASREVATTCWHRMHNLLLVLLTLLYPLTTKMVLTILHCREAPLEGQLKLVMASNPYNQCFTTNHLPVAVLGIAVLAFYCIGYPLYVMLSLLPFCRMKPFPHGFKSPKHMYNAAVVALKAKSTQRDAANNPVLPKDVEVVSFHASAFAPKPGRGLWMPSPTRVWHRSWGHFLANEEWPAMFWIRWLRFPVLFILSVVLVFTGTSTAVTGLDSRISGAVVACVALICYALAVYSFNPFLPLFTWRRPVVTVTQFAAVCAAILKVLAFSLEAKQEAALVERQDVETLKTVLEGWGIVTLAATVAVFIVLSVAFFFVILKSATAEARK